MSVDANSELQSFHQFVTEQLATGQPAMSPEEALDVWRLHHPLPEQFEEDVQALREALADVAAGDSGMPLEEYLADFRTRRRLDIHS